MASRHRGRSFKRVEAMLRSGNPGQHRGPGTDLRRQLRARARGETGRHRRNDPDRPRLPFARQIGEQVKARVEQMPGMRNATVNVVWTPPWTPERLSPDARKTLGIE